MIITTEETIIKRVTALKMNFVYKMNDNVIATLIIRWILCTT